MESRLAAGEDRVKFVRIDGTMKPDDRFRNVSCFQNDDGVQVSEWEVLSVHA